jgi:hypothetical protein
MPEYSLDFSQLLIDAAKHTNDTAKPSFDKRRTVLYFSCLSCELSLKALLENAGWTPDELKKVGHKLHLLLEELGKCNVTGSYDGETPHTISGTSVRGIVIEYNGQKTTIGKVLTAELAELISEYPNDIRYGEAIIQYPSEVWLQTADLLHQWAINHISSITKK